MSDDLFDSAAGPLPEPHGDKGARPDTPQLAGKMNPIVAPAYPALDGEPGGAEIPATDSDATTEPGVGMDAPHPPAATGPA
ncbi:MAG TPA: hypothetical protein VGB53_14335, partial [Rubricoccaceae bacterium]